MVGLFEANMSLACLLFVIAKKRLSTIGTGIYTKDLIIITTSGHKLFFILRQDCHHY